MKNLTNLSKVVGAFALGALVMTGCKSKEAPADDAGGGDAASEGGEAAADEGEGGSCGEGKEGSCGEGGKCGGK